ncbi:MAG: alpha/beta hydrolase [Methylotenera sp.]|nr:alpha/beta hydrolase [Oligoflexia bacterium]
MLPISPLLKKTFGRRPIMKGVHFAMKFAFERAGFHWELRRNGDDQLGLWKITFRKVPAHSVPGETPKRFIFVPGFGDTPLSWLTMLVMLKPVLSQNFDELIVLDFPGFGGFLAEQTPFASMDLLISSVEDCFDTLKPHSILGHSLGGWLAANYASHCGEGIRPSAKLSASGTRSKERYTGPASIICVDPSGVFGSEIRKEEWKGRFANSIDLGFDSYRKHIFKKEPFWFGAISGEIGVFLSKPEIVAFMKSIRDDHFIEHRLKHIRSQVWLLWGEEDTLVPSEWADAWLAGLHGDSGAACTRAEAVLIKGAGHSPQVEKPAVTAVALTQMIQGKTPHFWGSRWWTVRTS